MKLHEHSVRSRDGTYERTVWILENPPPVATRFGVFLDAEIYIHRMEARSILTDLQQQGRIPPMTCLFVSHLDGAARHEDLTCNAKFARFVAEDLVDWLRERVGPAEEEGHLIAGPSLGGLAAAHLALTYPNVFSRCLSHSGSFWWHDEWLTKHLPETPRSVGRFWLSVGDQETQSGISHPPTGLRQEIPQVDGCEHFAGALAKRGHDVHFSIHAGGHEVGPWHAELPEALIWLLNR